MYLLSTLIKERKCGALSMGEGSLLYEGIEQLGVKEVVEERPFNHRDELQELLMVEEEVRVSRPFRGGRE